MNEADTDLAATSGEQSPEPEVGAPAETPAADAGEPAPEALTAVPPVTPIPPRKRPFDALRALDAPVRASDEDRWLASRFAPKRARGRLVGLYALNSEIAAIPAKVREPRLGDIRLQWWRDALEGVFDRGETAGHPVLEAIAEAITARALPREAFDALLAARVCDLASAPFETWTDLESYLDATAGCVMRLAAQICVEPAHFTPAFDQALHHAARAWGYMGLLRAAPAWAAQGRTFYPGTLRENLGLGVTLTGAEVEISAVSFAAHAVLDRAIGAQNQIARFRHAIPKEAFPAIGYATLTPLYVRAFEQTELGRQQMAPPSLLRRQWRLVTAGALGAL
ncbi:MAG: phytoene/squalene synthase family protein [Hyphomonadaceae bacterium]